MPLSIGEAIRQAREVRRLSAVETARAAGISPAYLSKLENNAVKRPSPHVLAQLGDVLAVPYADLMRLAGYRVPGGSDETVSGRLSAALFSDLTDDERDELVEYLAWYRWRRSSGRTRADGREGHRG